MGKEAKIGLSIIGILVIIFAIVLGQRMLGSKDGSTVAKDGKKTSQSKKETDKKSDGSKKSRGSLFNTSGKKNPKSTKPGSKGKATPALAVSQGRHGTSGVSGKSADIWSHNRGNRTTAASPLMPYPSGSTSLEAYQRTGSPRPGVAVSPRPGVAVSPRPGVAVLGTPPQSPYTRQSGASDARYSSSGPSYATNGARGYGGTYGSKEIYGSGRAASSRQPTDRRYAASDVYNSNAYKSSGYGASGRYQAAPVGPKVGDARLDASGSYGRSSSTPGSSGYGTPYGSSNRSNSNYGSGSSYGGDSLYKSASYGSSRYGASSSGGSDYGGGAQSDGTYIVKPHQNYWAISKDVYGTGAYFKALAEANRNSIPDENRLKVGDRIKTPDLAELEQTYAELCPAPERRETMRKRAELASSSPRYGGSGRQYIVQSGDTLYDIARYELGDAARWTEIYEVNRQVLQDSFDYLTPGLKLTMPSKDGKSSLSETAYGSSSKYGESGSPYRTETKVQTKIPRTATRPSYGASSATLRSQPSSSGTNYGSPNYRRPNYGNSNYSNSLQQPSRAAYPRY